MNRTIIPALLFYTVFLSTPVLAQKNLGIAAVVNDEIISIFDLEGRLNMFMFSSSQSLSPQDKQRLIPQILRALIDDKLKLQEAKKRNIKVLQSEINRAILSIERSNDIKKGQLTNVLKKEGVPRSSLIEQIKAEISWSKVANRVLGSRIRISDGEINERLVDYQKNKKMPEHRISEIFLPVDSIDQEKKIKDLADRLYKQLRKGVSFTNLARSFSRANTANAGGRRGWVRNGLLDSKLQLALNSMQPRQFSKPIRSDDGFFILFLHNRRLPSQAEKNAPNAGTKVTLQQLFFPLPTKASLIEKASQLNLAKTMASTVFNCQDMEKAGKELGSSLSGKLGTMTMAKLPQNVQNAITNLPENKASAPIRASGGIIVLMVCKRIKSKVKIKPKAKLSDRKRVERLILNERLRAAARRYLRDLRSAAFIDIRL